MDLLRKPFDKKYQNWMKAHLAVKITKEGIEPFVYDEIEQFQQKCLTDICNNNGLPVGTTCSSCCTENVIVCPTNRICNARRRGKCSFHRNSATQYRPSGCPNKICHNFRKEIQNAHRFYGPSYKNSDATQWCSNTWEVAKCFMPPDGYKNSTSATETDFNGIIAVLINCGAFQSKVHADLNKQNNIFYQCRKVSTQITHCPSMQVSDADLRHYFGTLRSILTDPAYLASNRDAQIALRRLVELENEEQVSDDETRSPLHSEIDAEADVESDTEEKQFADSIAMKAKKAKIAGCSFSSLTDDIESGLPPPAELESLSRFLANYKGDIKSGTQAYVTSISRWYAECKGSPSYSLTNEIKSGKEVAISSLTSTKEEILTECRVDDESHAGEKQFADSIAMKAKLGRLPSASELAVLCQTYGRKSDKLKHVCDTICNHIKDECKHIVNVWPSYRPSEENNIVFCVITDIPCERIICPYSVVQRAIGEYSFEEREILKQEFDRGLEFTDDAVENCINSYTDTFMNNHKNLSVMSASLLKSEKFATSLEKVSQQVCIVLLVPVKGLIPLSEEAFPKFIDDFPVDVREGNFKYKFGGKPNDRHESLKMGCAIHGDEPGTLGGFLDHNEHGICCLTVAHVMLDVPKMKSNFPGQYIPESSELCYQPEPPNAFGYLIKAIAIEGNEDKSGMDVALVKIDERIPLNGRFPDAKNEKWLEAGYSSALEMQYTTGEVLEMSEIPRGKLVLKYGQATTITEGVVRLRGIVVRNVNFYDNSEGYKYSLKKQIQVRHITGDPFSKDGDSGSLVFVRGNDGHLKAIGMLVGGTDSYDVVTPICDILRELNTALSLKPFKYS